MVSIEGTGCRAGNRARGLISIRADPSRDRRALARGSQFDPGRRWPGAGTVRRLMFGRIRGDETLRPCPHACGSSRRGGLLVALALLTLSGCQKPAAKAAPPAPTVGVVESRRMSVPIEVDAQRDHPRPGRRDDPGPRPRVPHRAALRRGGDGQEGAAPARDRRGAVPGGPPVGAGPPGRGRRRRSARPRNRRGARSPRRSWSSTGPSSSLAQIQERRNRALVARNAGSAEDLDKTEADRKRWESQVEADRASLAQAKADYDVGIASAQAQVSAARAAVRDAELNLGYCRMYAPIDGRIGEARVKVGNLVGPGPGRRGRLHRPGHDPAARPDRRRHPAQLARPRPHHRADRGRARRPPHPPGPGGTAGASLRGAVLLHRQHRSTRPPRPSWSRPGSPTPAASSCRAST